ncbi:transcriptional regulatory protein ZraR [Desulfosporosinus acididurans]|uniref:Transcriptional regulatory protein ZraR n=1 Tax=Desulfosporosinus acididurans TaxID=476652 RepID=A0A0J1FVD4_9FIRM|nr:helix-turn-helix domain-containing protein [Desulfosporosinus acididurans]KLU67399.1 transcriptional regulatory protein ZraR [Desulfosporosinus acididurans]
MLLGYVSSKKPTAPSGGWSDLWKQEDYWAMWLGLTIVVLAIAFWSLGNDFLNRIVLKVPNYSDYRTAVAYISSHKSALFTLYLFFLGLFTIAVKALTGYGTPNSVLRKNRDCINGSETKEQLLKYSYPGNVRELFHLIERGRILAVDGKIAPKDIWGDSEEIQQTPSSFDSDEEFFNLFRNNQYPTLEEVEKHYIAAALKRSKGNKTQTASLLGISVRNLYRKLQSYESEPSNH